MPQNCLMHLIWFPLDCVCVCDCNVAGHASCVYAHTVPAVGSGSGVRFLLICCVWSLTVWVWCGASLTITPPGSTGDRRLRVNKHPAAIPIPLTNLHLVLTLQDEHMLVWLLVCWCSHEASPADLSWSNRLTRKTKICIMIHQSDQHQTSINQSRPGCSSCLSKLNFAAGWDIQYTLHSKQYASAVFKT